MMDGKWWLNVARQELRRVESDASMAAGASDMDDILRETRKVRSSICIEDDCDLPMLLLVSSLTDGYKFNLPDIRIVIAIFSIKLFFSHRNHVSWP